MTERSLASRYCWEELDRAIAENKTIIPYKLDSTPITTNYFAHCQWVQDNDALLNALRCLYDAHRRE